MHSALSVNNLDFIGDLSWITHALLPYNLPTMPEHAVYVSSSLGFKIDFI